MSAPTAEQQVKFLAQLQRLLNEGGFVASYKFALLLSLAGVSVEKGDDSGKALRVTLRDLAESFLRLYWRQTVPYVPVGRAVAGRVLSQNTDQQAAIINAIAVARAAHGGSLASLRSDERVWRKLVTRIASTVKNMPLWRLQIVGGEKLIFLYEHANHDDAIDLLPGVAFCFRRFHMLVQDLVQGAWIRFVRRLPENMLVLGEAKELSEFMFGSERSTLKEYQPILRDLQRDRCFYCQKALRGPGEVDHFVPWSRYSLDLAHNFVLAHTNCNNDKSDTLASVPHLERWCARNVERATELVAAFDGKRLLHDLSASQRIARWAYGQAESSQAQMWERNQTYSPLDRAWRALLSQ